MKKDTYRQAPFLSFRCTLFSNHEGEEFSCIEQIQCLGFVTLILSKKKRIKHLKRRSRNWLLNIDRLKSKLKWLNAQIPLNP